MYIYIYNYIYNYIYICIYYIYIYVYYIYIYVYMCIKLSNLSIYFSDKSLYNLYACSGSDLKLILRVGCIFWTHTSESLPFPMLQNGFGKLLRRLPKPELLKATHGVIPLCTIANPSCLLRSLHGLHSNKFLFIRSVPLISISHFLASVSYRV